MALETLRGLSEIGGFKILSERPKDQFGNIDWKQFDELRKNSPIYIDHDVNMISFRIQNGPIKEFGVNGCQLLTLIQTALIMVEKLNEKFPCEENKRTITKLGDAIYWQDIRTENRIKRGVEGESKC
jgi:hypothetical protein